MPLISLNRLVANARPGQRRMPPIIMLVVMTIVMPVNAPASGHCSIDTHGEAVYARVQEILRNNRFKADEVIFEPYKKIDIEMLPGCVFKLDGKFQVKTARAGTLKWKRFDAEFKRKDGAPKGFKKIRLQVSGG